jgi:hypothetical protein
VPKNLSCTSLASICERLSEEEDEEEEDEEDEETGTSIPDEDEEDEEPEEDEPSLRERTYDHVVESPLSTEVGV